MNLRCIFGMKMAMIPPMNIDAPPKMTHPIISVFSWWWSCAGVLVVGIMVVEINVVVKKQNPRIDVEYFLPNSCVSDAGRTDANPPLSKPIRIMYIKNTMKFLANVQNIIENSPENIRVRPSKPKCPILSDT
ncbi:hypothetical protein AYI68_g4704 [Smittium mucronatum]|uniref:Uncharacterized protein n=1 Tax=Smittium mucronatum TaxID=133383 RepID=A0A1R0GWB5_9FUNG|nr:hypothetical protein AYI68_g4704 [Smittium mucronatum]